ncbi:MAG TPA: SAM-dependent methyltransferase [Burkholderiales bacterium]|jgi:methyltransferase (TIGR00027 family)|nr:SAM-dependent methyltransferase [Burkholderiales bacterium]
MALTRAAVLLLAYVAWFIAQPAQAVRPGQVSSTAEATCGYRAIAAQHPDPKLRNPDDLAAKLCRWQNSLPRDYAAARPLIDQGETYSAFFYVNARTHYIDAALKKAAADGVTQVVVLGAGFDSRAYRFRASHPQLQFYEVDLPATIEAKKVRVAEALGALPDYVRYAPIDFNTQKLEEVLLPLGYDPKQRGFFLLEGVVMYVVEAGNVATFEFIRRNSAPGSVVVYDYVLRRVIEGDTKGLYAAAYLAFAVERVGEPYIFGWTPAEAAAWAGKLGFSVVEDVGDKELGRRHLTGSNGRLDGRLLDWHRLMEVRVP